MAEIATLTCPSCGAALKTNGQATRLRCEYCGNLHMIEQAPGQTRKPLAPLKRLIFQPQSVRIVKDDLGQRIIKRWFGPQHIFMGVFVLFWDGFLVFWYSIALEGNAPLIFFLFPLIHLTIGLVLTYTTLAGFLNTTTVELTQKELAVYYDPLPWPGEKTIPTTQIRQIYCKMKVSHSSKGTPQHSFKLYALTHELREIELVSNLDTPDAALFFEQQLEQWLKIEDVPVVGELPK